MLFSGVLLFVVLPTVNNDITQVHIGNQIYSEDSFPLQRIFSSKYKCSQDKNAFVEEEFSLYKNKNAVGRNDIDLFGFNIVVTREI